jgi:SAM-dependent methyltransferase
MQCPLCQQNQTDSIYQAGLTPVFQNKVYASLEQARQAACGPVELFACSNCNYVFNGRFDSSLMDYDGDYQNEQACSATFDQYLESLIDLLQSRGFNKQNKIIEVGCGKGTFLGKLWQRGFDAEGFDTAYEGDDPRVQREYFGDRQRGKQVDLIILRHTLEHIAEPLAFLQNLAELCPAATQIYIEVPAFEWIVKKRAFWDVFYEHCNYFSKASLMAMFDKAEHGYLFGDQYMYVLASLDDLRSSASASIEPEMELQALQQETRRYCQFVSDHAPLLLWGAGAKGSTFANLTDPEGKLIEAVVDINTKKAGAFLAGSGQPIIQPEQIAATAASKILVMNENYKQEIEAQLQQLGLSDRQVYTLGL